MSHQTYFQSIPRDINQMTLYYLPPEKLRSACESNDEFQRICHDPRFLENYAKEKMLLSPQIEQTHFLPRAERFQLLGEIGYEPLISFILEHEDDIDMSDIKNIAIGAAKKGNTDIINWVLSKIRHIPSHLPQNILCHTDLNLSLINAAIDSNHLNLAEKLFNILTASCVVNNPHIYTQIAQKLRAKGLYDVFRRFLQNVPEEFKIDFRVGFY